MFMNTPKSPTIKTLDEILAELSSQSIKTASSDTPQNHQKKNAQSRQCTEPKKPPKEAPASQKPPRAKAKKQPKETPNLPASEKKSQLEASGVINERLASVLADVRLESLAMPDKATQRLRWLAFYYLSNRELSTHQLRQKLLAKDCDPDAIELLLKEFAEKGYQSDERTAYMLIRENIRRGRGKQHIRQALKTAKISYDHLETLITAANDGSLTDGTILTEQDTEEPVDWLVLAVEARVKKYGDALPKDAKEKARQLRFLQYRGFEMGVCFDALKTTLADLEDR